MGYMNGLIVHDHECRALMITDDHAPSYNNVISGVVIEAGTTPGAPGALTTRLNLVHDRPVPGPKSTSTVARVVDTWHYPSECPERFNPANQDRRVRPAVPPRGSTVREDRDDRA